MTLSTAFLRLAVVAALGGVGMGVAMGASHDFAFATVHAHLNLLGWVSMFLYGLFYRLHPAAGKGRLAWAHFTAAVSGVLIFLPSLAMQLAGGADRVAVARAGLVAGPLLILSGMILFAVIVFRVAPEPGPPRA